MMAGYTFLSVFAGLIQIGLFYPSSKGEYKEPIKACILGHDTKIIADVTLEECKQKCTSAKFHCHSLEYIPKTSECHLANVKKMHKNVQQSGAFKVPCPDPADSLYVEVAPKCVGCPVPASVNSSRIILAARAAVQGLEGSGALGSTCGGVSLLKVEKAKNQVVKGRNYHLTLRLEIKTGQNCQEKVVKICQKVVVHQPLSCDISQDGCLKLIRQNGISCSETKEPRSERGDPCSEPFHHEGYPPCDARMPTWSYNKKTGECVKWHYGGCGGNNNRFPSEKTCADTCQKSVDRCSEPFAVVGPCKAAFQRWSYNQETGECEKFIYGGCSGNNNRFRSEQGCADTCEKSDDEENVADITDAPEPEPELENVISMEEPPVTVELYYETFCRGCKQFITNQLFPTFNKLKDTGIMKVGLFPYGNALELHLPDRWYFLCQHGERECLGNLLEACIMNHLDLDSSAYMPVINCMEGSDDPVDAAPGCVRDHSKLNYQDVDKCAKGSEGNALMHQIAVKTDGLSPPHKYVPWVLVNNIHNDEETRKDLLSYVCKIYKGTKPKECTQKNDPTNHTIIENIWRDYRVPRY